MFKRIFLFLLTNIAIIAVITVVITIIERVFGIQISGVSSSYLSIFIFAAIFGFAGAFISLAISRWMAKRAYNIKLITKEDVVNLGAGARTVFSVVEDLAERNRIKMPEVGIYESTEPNAFATGATKNKSLVAVSTGLLSTLDQNEIEGVIAHEMAHILNGDMVTMTLLQGVLNTFVIFFARIVANIISNFMDEELGWLGYMAVNIVLQILFGILASMVLMKFSRHREFKADEGSAIFVGKEKMIQALQALKRMQPAMIESDTNDNMAAFKISSKSKGGFREYFSSHPSLDDRIKALENLSI